MDPTDPTIRSETAQNLFFYGCEAHACNGGESKAAILDRTNKFSGIINDTSMVVIFSSSGTMTFISLFFSKENTSRY